MRWQTTNISRYKCLLLRVRYSKCRISSLAWAAKRHRDLYSLIRKNSLSRSWWKLYHILHALELLSCHTNRKLSWYQNQNSRCPIALRHYCFCSWWCFQRIKASTSFSFTLVFKSGLSNDWRIWSRKGFMYGFSIYIWINNKD